MKKKIAVLFALWALCIIIIDLEAMQRKTKEDKAKEASAKNNAEFLMAGKTIDAAWISVFRAMMRLDFRPTCGDKQSGYVDFVCNVEGETPVGKIAAEDCAGVTLFFHLQDNGVLVVGRWRTGYGGASGPEAFFKELFDLTATY